MFQKVVVFFLTFMVYVGLHSLREGWAYTKPQLQDAYGLTSTYLGVVDTLYLLSYAVGMYTLANLIKKTKLSYFIAVGMIFSCAFYLLIPVYTLIFSQFNEIFVAIAMCLNGFFQSTGWPGIMTVFGNWFGKGKRGLLMGIWAINANVGNIVAELMCNILQQTWKVSWIYNFICTGTLCLIIALLIIIFLKDEPNDKKNIQQKLEEQQKIKQSIVSDQEEEIEEKNRNDQPLIKNQQKQESVSVLRALFLPRVPLYVIGYSTLKGCIYGLMFWLPLYLGEKNLSEQKGYISSMIDIGSFIGGLIVGHLGDKYSFRALFLSPLLIISSAAMFLVSFALTDVAWMYYVVLFIIGICIGGPYNIIGSAITIDLGQQVSGNNVGSVSALIEGCAAAFGGISQVIIAILPFNAIFYLFCGQCIIAAIALFPLFLTDVKAIKARESVKK